MNTTLLQIQKIFSQKAGSLFYLMKHELMDILKEVLGHSSIEDSKKLVSSPLHLLSFFENYFSKMVLECYDRHLNEVDIVTNEKKYSDKSKEIIDSVLGKIEVERNDLPEVKVKKNLKSPKENKNSLPAFITYEPANDFLDLKKLNEINLRIFHYPEFNFSFDSDEFEALWLKSASKKLLRLRDAIIPERDNDGITKTFDEIKMLENKFYSGVKMEKVIEHFLPLTKENNKNGKPFLTETQLISFLQKAFLHENILKKQTINSASGDTGFVILRFYEFFDLSVSKYHEYNRKHKYIKLLSDNFTNWDPKQICSFFKRGKTTRKW